MHIERVMTLWLILAMMNPYNYLLNIYNVVLWSTEDNIEHGHTEEA